MTDRCYHLLRGRCARTTWPAAAATATSAAASTRVTSNRLSRRSTRSATTSWRDAAASVTCAAASTRRSKQQLLLQQGRSASYHLDPGQTNQGVNSAAIPGRPGRASHARRVRCDSGAVRNLRPKQTKTQKNTNKAAEERRELRREREKCHRGVCDTGSRVCVHVAITKRRKNVPSLIYTDFAAPPHPHRQQGQLSP